MIKRICIIVATMIAIVIVVGVGKEIVDIETEEGWYSSEVDAHLNFKPGPYVLWERDSKARTMLYWTEQQSYEARNVCWAIVIDRMQRTIQFENKAIAGPTDDDRPLVLRTWTQKSDWKIDSVNSTVYQNANRYRGVSDIFHFEHWWKCVPEGDKPGVTYDETVPVHPETDGKTSTMG